MVILYYIASQFVLHSFRPHTLRAPVIAAIMRTPHDIGERHIGDVQRPGRGIRGK
jgi:hypothetical protein